MVVNTAKETALKFGNHIPTLLIEGNRESVFVQLQNVPDTHDGRVQQMFTLGLTLAHEGIIGTLKQVFYISEAWMSVPQDGKLPDVRPSQDPKRVEVLIIVQVKVPQPSTQMVLLEMVRDRQGQLTALKDFKPSAGQGRSPVVNAFVRGFQMGMSGKLN